MGPWGHPMECVPATPLEWNSGPGQAYYPGGAWISLHGLASPGPGEYKGQNGATSHSKVKPKKRGVK